MSVRHRAVSGDNSEVSAGRKKKKKRQIHRCVQRNSTFKSLVGHFCHSSMQEALLVVGILLHESEGWIHISYNKKRRGFLRSVFTFYLCLEKPR